MNSLKKILNAASLLLSSTALLLSMSCCVRAEMSETVSGGSVLGFKASVGRVSSPDETKCSSEAEESRVIMLTSADGSISIPMTVVETEGVECPMTRGTLINGPETDGAEIPLKDSLNTFYAGAYITDSQSPVFTPEQEEVTWDGSVWSMEKTYYWPQATSLDIYAKANLPASDYATITLNKTEKTQKLVYTVPRDTDDQKDILMAMYSGTGDNEGRAELMFYHPLTAVQFSRAGSLEITGITQIIMAGVNYGGDVTQSMENPSTFDWNIQDKEQTVSQDNDGKPFEVHGDIDGDPFLLVPQQSNASRTVVLTVTLIYNEHEIPLNAVISDMHWFAGRTYTYRIGYNGNLEVSLDLQETSATEKGEAVISNVGTKKCYVRAIVDGFVTDEDGYIKRTYLGNEGGATGIGAFTAASGTFGTDNAVWNTYWIKGEDGFYYYTKPLEVDNAGHTNPNAKTTPLFDSYTFTNLGLYEYYEMNISTQAIEWDSTKSSVTANWGAEVAALLAD